jgi:acyl carrier protein
MARCSRASKFTHHVWFTAPDSRPDAAATLLAIIDGLAAESRPGFELRATLDGSLERDLGLDSLARVELISRIEDGFGVRLPEDTLSRAETPRDLLNALRAAGAAVPATGEAHAVQTPLARVEGLPSAATTLVEALDWHARAHPDRVHIVYLGDSDETNIRYGDLQRQVDIVATGLQRAGLEPRQTAAIMLPTSREYFQAYFGILRAGGIPVPIYPPARLSQIEEHVRRHAGILSNAEATILVTVPEARGVARLLEGRRAWPASIGS